MLWTISELVLANLLSKAFTSHCAHFVLLTKRLYFFGSPITAWTSFFVSDSAGGHKEVNQHTLAISVYCRMSIVYRIALVCRHPRRCCLVKKGLAGMVAVRQEGQGMPLSRRPDLSWSQELILTCWNLVKVVLQLC